MNTVNTLWKYFPWVDRNLNNGINSLTKVIFSRCHSDSSLLHVSHVNRKAKRLKMAFFRLGYILTAPWLFRNRALVISLWRLGYSLCRLGYVVKAPSLFRYVVFVNSLWWHRFFVMARLIAGCKALNSEAKYFASLISSFIISLFDISPSLFHYGAFVIQLCRLRYFVMLPSLFRWGAFFISLFRYGAFVMSPRNKEKTIWHKSATIIYRIGLWQWLVPLCYEACALSHTFKLMYPPPPPMKGWSYSIYVVLTRWWTLQARGVAIN